MSTKYQSSARPSKEMSTWMRSRTETDLHQPNQIQLHVDRWEVTRRPSSRKKESKSRISLPHPPEGLWHKRKQKSLQSGTKSITSWLHERGISSKNNYRNWFITNLGLHLKFNLLWIVSLSTLLKQEVKDHSVPSSAITSCIQYSSGENNFSSSRTYPSWLISNLCNKFYIKIIILYLREFKWTSSTS